MAGKKVQIKRYNGTSWEEISPITSYNNLTDVPSTFVPTAHTHPVSDITNFPDVVTGGTGGLVKDGVNLKAKLKSYSSAGTIGTTPGLVPVVVDSNGQLCVQLPTYNGEVV